MPPNVLVYGFYGKGNLGDDLFIDAFKTLFPQFQFTFADHIAPSLLEGKACLIFGGGSFLDYPPLIETDLINMPILYIGIGAETDIHPTHQQLIKKAKLVAIRSSTNIEKIKELNNNTIYIPDLVYSLNYNFSPKNQRKEKSILYIPNISTVPQWPDPYWKHLYWEKFKLEFSQTLDILIDEGYIINVFPMSTSNQSNDIWAAHEIINKMVKKGNFVLNSNEDCMNIFSQHELIITQRYHGIILAEITKTPFISIYHHNKLKSSHFNSGSFLSYFEISKQKILDEIFGKYYVKSSPSIPIEQDMFEELKHKVNSIILG